MDPTVVDSLTLGIELSDVFVLISAFFTNFWYLIALGLALLAFPRVVRAVRGAVGGSR